jgi:hypothetical protein
VPSQPWSPLRIRHNQAVSSCSIAHLGGIEPGASPIPLGVLTTDSVEANRLIEVTRWHILRADGLRNGLWMRAAAILSANALVVAGTSLLASVRSGGAWWGLATAILPLIASMASIYEACNAIGTVRGWSETFARHDSPLPMIYSAPDTVKALETHEKFRSAIMRRSVDEGWTMLYLSYGASASCT